MANRLRLGSGSGNKKVILSTGRVRNPYAAALASKLFHNKIVEKDLNRKKRRAAKAEIKKGDYNV